MARIREMQACSPAYFPGKLLIPICSPLKRKLKSRQARKRCLRIQENHFLDLTEKQFRDYERQAFLFAIEEKPLAVEAPHVKRRVNLRAQIGDKDIEIKIDFQGITHTSALCGIGAFRNRGFPVRRRAGPGTLRRFLREERSGGKAGLPKAAPRAAR